MNLRLGYAFNQELNAFAQKFLFTGGSFTQEDLRRAAEATLQNVCTQLMFHEGLGIDVYGENMPACLLLNWFGLRGVEELLEAGAVEFVLNADQVMWIEQPSQGGAHPLAYGKLTDPIHSDPEASVNEGLRRTKLPLRARKRADLSRKLVAAYRTEPEFSADAVKLANSAHKNGLLAQFGLPATKSPFDFDRDEREHFADLASDLRRVSVLATAGYEATAAPKLYSLTRAEVERVAALAAVEYAASTVFTIENLPSFGELVASGNLKAADIPRLRQTEAARQFRSWLRNLDGPTDASTVSAAYVQSIARTRGWGRAALGKSVVVSSISQGLGIAVSSVLVGPGNPVLGAAIGVGIDVGINALDASVLAALGRKWTPRCFVDSVRDALQP